MATNLESPSGIVGVCIDQSDHSRRAFDWYVKEYHKEGRKVALIHVHSAPALPVVPLHGLSGPGILSDKWIAELEKSLEDSRKLLHAYRDLCETAKIPYLLVAEVRGDNIGEAIVHAAQKLKVDSLIIGNRGLGTVRRTFLGSVSDYVVHHAMCPVTVVPPAQEGWHLPHSGYKPL